MPCCSLLLRCCAVASVWFWVGPVRAEDGKSSGQPAAKADAVALRPQVALVKPVILRDDDGSNPARHDLPKALLDQAYSRADLEILFLDPVMWDHGPARRGEIKLDEIVKRGRATGVIAADPRVLTLLFVTRVDGKDGPLGRGLQGGNVCFIALGPEGKMQDPEERAFVMGHEIGHCFGLQHAADDPEAPDDVPNLMGEGKFSVRVAADGLQPSQVATIRRSRLVVPRVHCHGAAEARDLLMDEAWFPLVSSGGPDWVRFSLGLAPDAPVPAAGEERVKFSRAGHAAMALDFTPQESAALKRSVAALVREAAGEWPLLTRLPWHFIKVKSGFCNDLPHTRGLAIVLSEATLAQMVEEPEMSRYVLFHEKIHVAQRLNPGRFTALYRSFGYTPVRLAAGEAERLKLVCNPDAPVKDQAAEVDGKQVLVSPVFVPAGDRLGLKENYFLLKPKGNGEFVIAGEFPPAPVELWIDRFPIRSGYDHPNEAFAYLCNLMLDLRQRKGLDAAKENPLFQATLEALPEVFRLAGDEK